jgi:hypothetical protein
MNSVGQAMSLLEQGDLTAAITNQPGSRRALKKAQHLQDPGTHPSSCLGMMKPRQTGNSTPDFGPNLETLDTSTYLRYVLTFATFFLFYFDTLCVLRYYIASASASTPAAARFNYLWASLSTNLHTQRRDGAARL